MPGDFERLLETLTGEMRPEREEAGGFFRNYCTEKIAEYSCAKLLTGSKNKWASFSEK